MQKSTLCKFSFPATSRFTAMTDGDATTLTLNAYQASKISHVSLYSGYAEVTRHFRIALKDGQNEVLIQRLPLELLKDSIRVEGRGHAFINDVVISRTLREKGVSTEQSSSESILKRRSQELEKELDSVRHAREGVDVHLDSLLKTSTEADFYKLEDMVSSHRGLARKLDRDILNLEEELRDMSLNIKKLKASSLDSDILQRPWQVKVLIQAKISEEMEFYIKYVVGNADWYATYDIRADTQSQGDNAITIVYKASIMQNTGESWDNVPLTLETSTPTYGLSAPPLWSWKIGEVIPRPPIPVYNQLGWDHNEGGLFIPPAPGPAQFTDRAEILPGVVPLKDDSASISSGSTASWSEKHTKPAWCMAPVMQHKTVVVAKKGAVTATFRVPGYITVPSDAQQHKITISKFEFKAPLLWQCVPQTSAQVYMQAKITNDSDYTFIPGPAHVYIDGSFVATTHLPSVSPKEAFDCALGIDPSLRVTYHPREYKASSSGFYKKSTTETFTQRISILNTKSVAVSNLKVVHCIPVSGDSRITVKLLNPALPLPSGTEPRRRNISLSSRSGKGKETDMPRVYVSATNLAEWNRTENPHSDRDMVGKDGMVRWVISKLLPQETVTLVLKYDISFPEGVRVDNI